MVPKMWKTKRTKDEAESQMKMGGIKAERVKQAGGREETDGETKTVTKVWKLTQVKKG